MRQSMWNLGAPKPHSRYYMLTQHAAFCNQNGGRIVQVIEILVSDLVIKCIGPKIVN